MSANSHRPPSPLDFVVHTVEPMQSGIARALAKTAETSNQLTATYAAFRKAITSLDATLSAEQYARRDGEWLAFYDKQHLANRSHSSLVVAEMHNAFNAGWAARKKADYELAFGLDTPPKA